MKEHRKIMGKKMVTYFCYVIMMLSSVSGFSCVEEPPEPKPDGIIPPGLPIDGGISFLLIAGAVYGVYVIKKNKKTLLKD
ncbi:MAG: PID-CTERM protein-sorting domain-containing protein [Lutibacter sp.]